MRGGTKSMAFETLALRRLMREYCLGLRLAWSSEYQSQQDPSSKCYIIIIINNE